MSAGCAACSCATCAAPCVSDTTTHSPAAPASQRRRARSKAQPLRRTRRKHTSNAQHRAMRVLHLREAVAAEGGVEGASSARRQVRDVTLPDVHARVMLENLRRDTHRERRGVHAEHATCARIQQVLYHRRQGANGEHARLFAQRRSARDALSLCRQLWRRRRQQAAARSRMKRVYVCIHCRLLRADRSEPRRSAGCPSARVCAHDMRSRRIAAASRSRARRLVYTMRSAVGRERRSVVGGDAEQRLRKPTRSTPGCQRRLQQLLRSSRTYPHLLAHCSCDGRPPSGVDAPRAHPQVV